MVHNSVRYPWAIALQSGDDGLIACHSNPWTVKREKALSDLQTVVFLPLRNIPWILRYGMRRAAPEDIGWDMASDRVSYLYDRPRYGTSTSWVISESTSSEPAAICYKKERGVKEEVSISPVDLRSCQTELTQEAFEPAFIPTHVSFLSFHNKSRISSNPVA